MMQNITTIYRGFKIHMFTYHPNGIRRMIVEVEPPGDLGFGSGLNAWYRTTCGNLQEAMAYATNAVAYHLDGDGWWPSGLPLLVKQVLRRPSDPPQTVQRHHLGVLMFQDGRVTTYLKEKMVDPHADDPRDDE
jgi:hypothetical protein